MSGWHTWKIGNDDFLDDEDNIEKVLAKYRQQIVDMKKTTEAQLQKKEDQLKETQRVMVQQQKAVEAACSAPSSDTSMVGDYQVCSLTQLYSVGFL